MCALIVTSNKKGIIYHTYTKHILHLELTSKELFKNLALKKCGKDKLIKFLRTSTLSLLQVIHTS